MTRDLSSAEQDAVFRLNARSGFLMGCRAEMFGFRREAETETIRMMATSAPM